MTQALHIGKTAKTTGLSVDTIRFYQKAGLVRPPARTSGGYRVFTEADIGELQFIGKAQTLGFSLAEIKELMAVSPEAQADRCPAKIAALRHLERELIGALGKCRRLLKGHEGCCPAIDAIERSAKKRTP